MFEANSLVTKGKHIIFGGKNNFKSRMKGLISRDEFKKNRLSSIYSIGEPLKKGNRLFKIIDIDTIVFKPHKDEHYELKLKCTSRKYRRYLELLIQHQELKDLSITYKLSHENIWISFDESILKNEVNQFKKFDNRVLAIDMNPNYIGYSIIDWVDTEKFNVIDKGVLSLKNLNDSENNYQHSSKCNSSDFKLKYFKNKRKFEILECVKFLKNKMVHYRCGCFSIENLNFKRKNSNKGTKFNKLCNRQWDRTIFVNCIEKWCNIYGVYLAKVYPEYSSIVGNLVYREFKCPDMVLASFEISRRGFEYYHQYVLKDRNLKKNIVLIELTSSIKSKIQKSLEELESRVEFDNLIDLSSKLKKLKCKYRFPHSFESLSQKLLKFQNFLV